MGEGTAIRPTAALVHFELLRRQSQRYCVTQLGTVVADPLDDELSSAILKCIRNPALYAEVIARFETEGRIPSRLSTILERQFGIIPAASELAADVFVQSAVYSGLIDENLNFRNGAEGPQSQEDARAVVGSTDEAPDPPGALPPERQDKGPQQEFRFRLTANKFAQLVVPADIDARDVRILRKQIELLELQTAESEGQE